MSEHKCLSCLAALDLSALKLAPISHLTAERQKVAAESERATTLEKQLADAAKAGSLTAARLALAGSAAPSEREAKLTMAAYQADIEGNDKPPLLSDWLAGDGARWAPQAAAASAPAPSGAPAPVAAPVAPPAPAPPNTAKGTVAAPAASPAPAALVQQKIATLVEQARRAKSVGDNAAFEAAKKAMADLGTQPTATSAT